MFILLAIIVVVVLMFWLPNRYGMDGDKNPPPPPPPDYDFWVNDPSRDPRNRR